MKLPNAKAAFIDIRKLGDYSLNPEHDRQRYIVDFPLTRNDNTANIRTTWIIRPNETFPRLTSCYIRR